MIIGIGQTDIFLEEGICDPVGTLCATRYGVGWTLHGYDGLVSTEWAAPVVNHIAASEIGISFKCGSVVKMINWCYALEFNENLHDTTVRL